MKFSILFGYFLVTICLILLLFTSCKSNVNKEVTNKATIDKTENATIINKDKEQLSNEFKKYWFEGLAEITSYELEQARYGELRKGKAVLIYVTEPFLADKQVKADQNRPENIQVLKLNATKKFLTGIYPYSIMSSTFYPLNNHQHALKSSFSAQEWCGHVYSQINNREQFEFTSHSYFETEADEKITLEKTVLENELWNQIRVNPDSLPTGTLKIIPSFEYIRLSHKKMKAYEAVITRTNSDWLTYYEINYPELNRTITINFKTDFPHSIESWTEEFVSGYGPNAKKMVSKASKLKQIRTKYWSQNSNADVVYRDSLGL